MPAFDDADRGLAHGDPHLENVLWNGAHVTALLDLEWARPTWLHADLETLLAISLTSRDGSHRRITKRASNAPITRTCRAGCARRIRARSSTPRLADLLAVLRASRELGLWSDHPHSYAPERLLTAVT